MENDKDLRYLFCEIIVMLLMIAIIIPVCVNASNYYNSKKKDLQSCNNIGINVSNKSGNMIVSLDNKSNHTSIVNLILKTSKFSNDYVVYLDGKYLRLNDMEYFEDDNYYYFNLRSYKIRDSLDVAFKLHLMGDNIYDDSITYSFIAEVANC